MGRASSFLASCWQKQYRLRLDLNCEEPAGKSDPIKDSAALLFALSTSSSAVAAALRRVWIKMLFMVIYGGVMNL